jgi:putative cell wall-binding protein
MKRFAAVLISVVVIISLAVVAFAAETQKGTIKGVDSKAGTITFCPEGTTKDITLKADKSVDLTKVKPDTKAEVTVDKDTVKGIKEMKKPKPAIGC